MSPARVIRSGRVEVMVPSTPVVGLESDVPADGQAPLKITLTRGRAWGVPVLAIHAGCYRHLERVRGDSLKGGTPSRPELGGGLAYPGTHNAGSPSGLLWFPHCLRPSLAFPFCCKKKLEHLRLKGHIYGPSLAVQWLRLHLPAQAV